jgi:hypothetical protein
VASRLARNSGLGLATARGTLCTLLYVTNATRLENGETLLDEAWTRLGWKNSSDPAGPLAEASPRCCARVATVARGSEYFRSAVRFERLGIVGGQEDDVEQPA